MNTANTPGAIVAGVDGSQAALHAVRWAAVEARSVQCPLRLVHTVQWPLVSYPIPPGLRADWTREMHQEGRGWLSQAKETAELAAPGVHTEVHLFTGDPRQQLLTEAQHARELVVGSRGLGGFSGMLLGSTSATVTQHSPCPVVVVHGQGDPTGPIVVGLDGSTASDQALRYAFEAASRTGTPLLAVHAWAGLGAAKLLIPPANELTFESIEAAEHRMLAEQLAVWQEKYPDVAIEHQVIHQRPAAALIELGHHARILVVGSHGRGGFTRLLLGSVSQAVAQHAPCPVAVVRTQQSGTDRWENHDPGGQ